MKIWGGWKFTFQASRKQMVDSDIWHQQCLAQHDKKCGRRCAAGGGGGGGGVFLIRKAGRTAFDMQSTQLKHENIKLK